MKFEQTIVPDSMLPRHDAIESSAISPIIGLSSQYGSSRALLSGHEQTKADHDEEVERLQWPARSPKGIGIGVITYNRLNALKKCLARVARYTETPFFLVVADDGSSDGTLEWLRASGVPFVTGSNKGCAINKNRAIGYLMQYTDCDPIILIEEDAFPDELSWERDWIAAALKYGQANFATSYQFEHQFEGGRGTVESPWWCQFPSAQCTATRRDEIERVGYLDSRFKGYGHEHIEWTTRMFRGREYVTEYGAVVYPAFNSGFRLFAAGTYENVQDIVYNSGVIAHTLTEEIYRHPFRQDEQGSMDGRTFQAELRAAAGRVQLSGCEDFGTALVADPFSAVCAKPAEGACDKALVTLATEGMREPWLRSFLNSVEANGGSGFKTFVFYEEQAESSVWTDFFAQHGGVTGIPFRSLRSVSGSQRNWTVKGLLYGVTQYIEAEKYICIDCDTLVLAPLEPLFDATDLCADESVFLAYDGNGYGENNCSLRGKTLADANSVLYRSSQSELSGLSCEVATAAKDCRLICNSGVIVATRTGLSTLNQRLQSMMPQAWHWIGNDKRVPREQMLVNIAISDGLGKELHGRYNWQLHTACNNDIQVLSPFNVLNARGERIAILHFSGGEKELLCPELRSSYENRCDDVQSAAFDYSDKTSCGNQIVETKTSSIASCMRHDANQDLSDAPDLAMENIKSESTRSETQNTPKKLHGSSAIALLTTVSECARTFADDDETC